MNAKVARRENKTDREDPKIPAEILKTR